VCRQILAVECPRECLRNGPLPRTLAIEPELGAKAIKPFADSPLGMSQLEGPDDRRERELPLANERFGIDDEPRLALGTEDVVPMQVLVEENLLALARRQFFKRPHRRVQEPALERPSSAIEVLLQRLGPPAGLLGQRAEGKSSGNPETGKKLGKDGQRSVGAGFTQGGAGPAAFEEERPALAIVGEEAHCAVSVPCL
jgi:hypothetical protein